MQNDCTQDLDAYFFDDQRSLLRAKKLQVQNETFQKPSFSKNIFFRSTICFGTF